MFMYDKRNTCMSALIHWVRIDKGYTLSYVSKETGLSMQYISEIEHCEKDISPKTYHLLCVYLGIPEVNQNEIDESEKKMMSMIESYLYKKFDEVTKIAREIQNNKMKPSIGILYNQLILQTYNLLLQANTNSFQSFMKIFESYYEKMNGEITAYYYLLKAFYYDLKQEYKNSIECINYSFCNIGTESKLEPLLLAEKAAVLMKNGNLINALLQCQKTIEVAMKFSIFPLILTTKMNQSIIYVYLKQYADAIQGFKECIQTANTIGDDDIALKCNVNIALTYLCQEKYNQAYELADLVLRNKPQTIEMNFVQKVASYFNIEKKKSKYNRNMYSKEFNSFLKLMDSIQVNYNDKEFINKALLKYENEFMFQTILRNYIIYNCVKHEKYDLAFCYLSTLF